MGSDIPSTTRRAARVVPNGDRQRDWARPGMDGALAPLPAQQAAQEPQPLPDRRPDPTPHLATL